MTTAKTPSTERDTQPVGRVIRVNVSPADWRTLRVHATEQDEPMTNYLGAILAREADKRRR